MSLTPGHSFRNHCILLGVCAPRSYSSHLSPQHFIINYKIQFIFQFLFLDCTRDEMHPHTNALGQDCLTVTKDYNNDEGGKMRGCTASQLIKCPTDFASAVPTDGD